MEENKNSLLYWWPKIKDLGIPVPRTHIQMVDADAILPAFDGQPMAADLLSELAEASKVFGFPVFLRTDLQSGKHGWEDTCYIAQPDLLMRNMLGVVEENLMGSCMFGDMFRALVFREFLDLEVGFIAFYGNLPVNKERRYFIEDGNILCHHPYWPSESIEEHTQETDWQEKLATLNEETPKEVKLLSEYALKVSAALPGYWSVDFAKAKDGAWYLIDMALAANSYHWPGCVNENLLKRESVFGGKE